MSKIRQIAEVLEKCGIRNNDMLDLLIQNKKNFPEHFNNLVSNLTAIEKIVSHMTPEVNKELLH